MTGIVFAHPVGCALAAIAVVYAIALWAVGWPTGDKR